MRVLVRLPVLMLLVSCDPAGCVLDNDCKVGYTPVSGSPADYTTAPGERQGVRIEAPAACGDEGDVVIVVGQGTRHFTFASTDGGCWSLPDGGPSDSGSAASCPTVVLDPFLADLKRAAEAAGIVVRSTGIRACKSKVQLGAFIHIDDWKKADATVEITAKQVARWELDERVGVLVGRMAIACPM